MRLNEYKEKAESYYDAIEISQEAWESWASSLVTQKLYLYLEKTLIGDSLDFRVCETLDQEMLEYVAAKAIKATIQEILEWNPTQGD